MSNSATQLIRAMQQKYGEFDFVLHYVQYCKRKPMLLPESHESKHECFSHFYSVCLKLAQQKWLWSAEKKISFVEITPWIRIMASFILSYR